MSYRSLKSSQTLPQTLNVLADNKSNPKVDQKKKREGEDATQVEDEEPSDL